MPIDDGYCKREPTQCIGKFKIGLIAEERKPHLTNKVVGDPRVGDQEWAQREGMVAFAGYPLIVDGEMTGVMGVFAKHELSADTLETLRSASNALAVGIRQKKTETVLRNAEQRLRATIEAAPAAMVMVDQTGQIVLVNAETEQLFGYVRDELLGQSVEMLVPPRFRKDHSDHRTSFFDKPAARPMGEGRELTGVSKDGVEFPVEIGLNPVHTDEGLFVLSAILDITERTQLTESLRQSNVELVVCQ